MQRCTRSSSLGRRIRSAKFTLNTLSTFTNALHAPPAVLVAARIACQCFSSPYMNLWTVPRANRSAGHFSSFWTDSTYAMLQSWRFM